MTPADGPSKLGNMKATFDLPDELYRALKARSALEGRSVRSVAVEVLGKWLAAGATARMDPADELTEDEIARYPWLAATRPYVARRRGLDLEDIRAETASAWAGAVQERLAGQVAEDEP